MVMANEVPRNLKLRHYATAIAVRSDAAIFSLSSLIFQWISLLRYGDF
jgi:hypothetical protein